MNFTPDKYRKYFEHRLGRALSTHREQSFRCPFHDDTNPSFSLNLEKGCWKCHASCGEGGVIDFEMRFSSCDRDAAWANIAGIIGEKVHAPREEPEAIYQYRDALGRVVFEKLRFPGKRFSQRQPSGKGGWNYNLNGVSKPLYNFPAVLTASQVFVVEGEKDADNLSVALVTLASEGRVAVTTNFDGAGKWRDEYSIYFAGKRVVILPDNDELGGKHAETVARSISSYALGVKILKLSGLLEKGDVSDYLQSHSIQDLFTELKACPTWHRDEEQAQRLLVSAPPFIAEIPERIDWMVEGVIQRGANGFICADPKVGKSWSALDLALSLALGVDWLEFKVSRPVKVALVSREDNPALTAWRLKHLFAGKVSQMPGLIESNLCINSRRQSPQLMLDNPDQMAELTDALLERQTEFVIFDVFNVLHTAEENDAREMSRVMATLTALQAKTGAAIGVLHHFTKGTAEMSLTQRLRGSSAISGWCEWLIGLSIAERETKIRKMEFEIKAAESPEPIFFTIQSEPGWAKLNRNSYTPEIPTKVGASSRYMKQ